MQSSQLDHWRGEFGNDYIDRNRMAAGHVRAQKILWKNILDLTKARPPSSVLEVGSNIGINLAAIRTSLPRAKLGAAEPNAKARAQLQATLPDVQITSDTAQKLSFNSAAFDLVFTSGVLIHIAPDDLLDACTEIHRCARHYIVCIEYFSDEPEQKRYRGHDALLYKRDFGGFYLDHFPDLEPIGCGFNWKRTTGLDNSTWWLFKKRLQGTPPATS